DRNVTGVQTCALPILDAHRTRSAACVFGRGANATMIRVIIPPHLRTLADVDGEVQLEVTGPVTVRSVLDALEARYPALRGTIRRSEERRVGKEGSGWR